jgi:hypothetical protein
METKKECGAFVMSKVDKPNLSHLLKQQEVFSGKPSDFEAFKNWFLTYVDSLGASDVQKILTAHSHLGGAA